MRRAWGAIIRAGDRSRAVPSGSPWASWGGSVGSAGPALTPGPALHNPEAEVYVLGACLVSPEAAQTVCSHLRETDLFDARHQRLLRAIRAALSRDESPTVELLVADLRAADQLDQIGGVSYLTQLWEAVPTAANVRRYLRLVRDASTRRRLREACLRKAEQFSSPDTSLPELVAQLAEDVDCAGDVEADRVTVLPVKIDRALTEWVQAWDQGPPTLLSTGYGTIDRQFGGGFEDGEFLVMGGRQGTGKTALALELAYRVAHSDRGVLIVSREMRLRKLLNRLLAQTGRIPALELRSGRLSPSSYARLTHAMGNLKPLPLWLDDRAESMAQIETMVLRWPFTPRLSLVVVDYLQLVNAPKDIRERRHQVEHISRSLKNLAHKSGCVILALSALSRPERGNEDRRPVISDLRESGQIDHDADVAMLLHRKFGESETEVIIAKARDGGVGIGKLTFRSEYVAFEEDREE